MIKPCSYPCVPTLGSFPGVRASNMPGGDGHSDGHQDPETSWLEAERDIGCFQDSAMLLFIGFPPEELLF